MRNIKYMSTKYVFPAVFSNMTYYHMYSHEIINNSNIRQAAQKRHFKLSQYDRQLCLYSTNGNPTTCHIKVTTNITVYGKIFHWKKVHDFHGFSPNDKFFWLTIKAPIIIYGLVDQQYQYEHTCGKLALWVGNGYLW